MVFTDWLSEEMHKRGWSQAELAREAEITKGALSHIFSGTRQPGVVMLKSIARAFHLPAEHVFRVAGILETETESDPQKISDLDEWIRIFVEADRETRQHLLDIARSVRVGKVKPPHQS
jgi:transcriptional regulator with XRE-family HTH domain